MEKFCCIVNQPNQLLSVVFVNYIRDEINIAKELVRVIDCEIQKRRLDNKDENY